jgi:hypothetical protein
MSWDTYYGVKEDKINDLLKSEALLVYKENERFSKELKKYIR